MKLHYQETSNYAEGFVNADQAGEALDRKSCIGFIFFVRIRDRSWESKKQTCVTLSSREAEYKAMPDASKEAIFINHLLEELL